MSEKSEFYEQMMTRPLSDGNKNRKGRTNAKRREVERRGRVKNRAGDVRLPWMIKGLEDGTISPPPFGPF